MSKRIEQLYDEAASLHGQAKAILSEHEEKGLPADRAEQVDTLLDQVESLTAQAKQLERAAEAEKAFLETERKAIFNETQMPDNAQIKVGERVLTADEVAEMKALLPFPGYMADLDAKAQTPYAAAMRAFLRKGDRELPDTLRKALQAGTAPAGGYLVQDVFLNLLIVKEREASAMRRIANVLPPVPSGSVITPSEENLFSDATWTHELGTGAEDVVQPFGSRRLTPHPLAKRVKVSNTLLRLPTFDVEGYIRDRMAYKFMVPEENAFINGDGVGKPLGILNTAGLPTLTTAAANVVSGDDIINWVYRLPAAYAPQARILANRAFIRKIRTLKTGVGDYLWQPGLQMGSPNRILDTPYELSDQYDDGLDVNDVWEDNAIVAVIGDFSYYWIVDALQMSIQRLVELYAEANQTGFIGRKETDGMAVLAEAFYALRIRP
jgi:HK97 family phage major capsid protein